MSGQTGDNALDMRVNKIPLAKLGDQKLTLGIRGVNKTGLNTGNVDTDVSPSKGKMLRF